MLVIGVKIMLVCDFKLLELVSLGISLHELMRVFNFCTRF